MRTLIVNSVCAALALAPAAGAAGITVRTDDYAGRIDPFVYGQFLEHIYHSVGDGLGGELVRNRSFAVGDRWSLEDGVLAETAGAVDGDDIVLAGDTNWTDYEFTLEACKDSGSEGFLIVFRAEDNDNFCWWNLGGWGNTKHGLEVESGGARRVTSESPGQSIESGRWIPIRVRVEGNHFEGWVDGVKLLDVHESSRPRGGIGLNTWATKARFRNLRATDLGGNELPVRLRLPEPADPAAPWVLYPTGSPGVAVVRTDSPNTGRSARIELLGVDTGIAQGRFLAKRGHRYEGRAWLRAEGGVRNVRARMVASDGRVISEAPLVTPGSRGWSERPFTLSSDVDDPDATLAIVADGTGALLIDMVSLMRDDSIATGCRADLLEAVKGLQPPIIRWPGGCFASIYRWKIGIGPQNERRPFLNSVWGEWDDSSFGTDEFLRLCREVGAEPLVVLNLGSWDAPSKWEEYLEEALEWVEYLNGDASTPMGKLRAENGHPEPYNVTHIELDNETWGMKVDGYAERLLPFARALRERWPGLKLYACTFWNSEDPRLLELVGKEIDYISYHLYDDPNAYANGPLAHEALWNEYPAMIAASPNPEVTLAVTEWNAQSTDWRTGLFAGGLLNVMERNPKITMATPALFLRRVDATAWDNAFINHDHVGWFPAPNYVVMKLYREHFAPVRLGFSCDPPLNAMASRSEDGATVVLKVVNPSDQAIATVVSLEGGFQARRGTKWTVEAELTDRNTLEAPHRIAPVEEALTAPGQSLELTLPPLSVTVVELER